MFSINIFTVLTITCKFSTLSGGLTRFRQNALLHQFWCNGRETRKSGWEQALRLGRARLQSCHKDQKNIQASQKRTYLASVIPSEVEGPCVQSQCGVPHPFFAFFAKKGGRQDCQRNLTRQAPWKGTTSVVPEAPEKDSGPVVSHEYSRPEMPNLRK